MFSTGPSGKLGIFALKDGATSTKLVLDVDPMVKESLITSLFTLSLDWEFERFGWRNY